MATICFLAAFALLAIIEGGRERGAPPRQALWGAFVVDKVGVSKGAMMIAMTPVEDSTDVKMYDVSGSQAAVTHILQLATTALMNKTLVEVFVDPAENPYPTILSFFLTDRSMTVEGGESDAPESQTGERPAVKEELTGEVPAGEEAEGDVTKVDESKDKAKGETVPRSP